MSTSRRSRTCPIHQGSNPVYLQDLARLFRPVGKGCRRKHHDSHTVSPVLLVDQRLQNTILMCPSLMACKRRSALPPAEESFVNPSAS